MEGFYNPPENYVLIEAPNLLREGKLLSIYNFDPGRNRHAVCLLDSTPRVLLWLSVEVFMIMVTRFST
jgi:hypothetical protein